MTRKRRKKSSRASARGRKFLERARPLLLHEFGTDREIWAWFYLKDAPIRSVFAAVALDDGLGTVGIARLDEDDLLACESEGKPPAHAITTVYVGREEAALILKAVGQAFPDLL